MPAPVVRRLLGAVVPLGVLASMAWAAPTYDVAREDRWKPGDVVTVTTTEDRYQEIRFPGREAEMPSTPRRLKAKAVAIEACLETDADGHRTRTRVWFPTWSFDTGTTKDESLQGAVVEVKGRGKERTHALVGAPTAPSKPAAAWLARTYGAGRPDGEGVRRAWLPKVAVAIGDEWGADLGAVLDGLWGAELIDRAKATSSARLAKADGGRAEIVCVAALPVTALPGGKGGKAVPWSKGGTYAVKGTLSVGVEGRLVESLFATSSTLEGEAVSGESAVAVLHKVDRRVEVKVGGEMLDPSKVPPLPAPADAPKDPVAPTK
jgi:hypothetical protein